MKSVFLTVTAACLMGGRGYALIGSNSLRATGSGAAERGAWGRLQPLHTGRPLCPPGGPAWTMCLLTVVFHSDVIHAVTSFMDGSSVLVLVFRWDTHLLPITCGIFQSVVALFTTRFKAELPHV